jgi:hypothetical protein
LAVPPLKNPSNDARAIADALKRVGFERVVLHLDVTKKQLTDAIADFVASARDAKLALVYFAGHGLQIDGVSYLLPVDAKLEKADDIASQALALGSLLGQLDSPRALKLVIVDACRDNPFRIRLAGTESVRSRSTGYIAKSIGRGLGRIESAGHDALVAYAARDGSLAFDGDGPNSPFAAAILKQLDVPGMEVGLMFRRIRDHVLAATGKKQEPYTYGSIGADEVYLWPIEGGLELNLSTVDKGPEQTLRLRKETEPIVATLKNADLKALARYVHPTHGLLIDGITLHRKDLFSPSFANKEFGWVGAISHDAPDAQSIMSVKSYLKRFYREAYFGPRAEVWFQTRSGEVGPEILVEYHVPSSVNAAPPDWSRLRFLFNKMDGRWFLVRIDHEEWQI